MARRVLVARPEPRRHDDKAEAEQRWDLLGVGYVLKAWGWQVLTDMHGEIIVKEAIDPTRTLVRLRHAGVRLQEIQRLLGQAIVISRRPTARSTPAYLAAATRSTTAIARSG